MTASNCSFSYNVCRGPVAEARHCPTQCFSIHFQHFNTDVHYGKQWKAGSFTTQYLPHSPTASLFVVWFGTYLDLFVWLS